MPQGDDPLLKYTGPLVAVLLALLVCVLIAALIGGAMPLDYTGRALVYLALLVYVVAGAVIVFKLTAAGESQRFSAQRVVKWVLSIWLWPLLLVARKGTPQ